ncbi:MAG: X-Pro dipeptidyl-peptidase, partial [Pseudomonadota bacterium]|nr:X-Pro dipeptidyl-peptidase [Pseudomonadota bacterium]
MRMTVTRLLLLLVMVSPCGFAADEQAEKRAEYIRANYTKYEYQIPMRDGVKLFTSVYIPNEDGASYPILM